MKKHVRFNTRLLVLGAFMAAVAAVLSWVEGFIPIQTVVPLPGLKFGLANIITMFAIFFLGNKQTFAIVIVRCVLGAAFGGGLSAFAFSITGALMAATVMMLMKKGYDKHFSLYGISLAGAAAFNMGQVIVAAIILQDIAIFSYLPLLMIGGIVTGILTAVISTLFFKRIEASGIVTKFMHNAGVSSEF